MEIKGKLIDNKYKIIELIGEGSISYTYKAKNVSQNTEKYYALKILKPGNCNKKIDDIIRIKRDNNILSKNSRSNKILFFKEYGEFEGNQYFLTDYINSDNLDEFIKKRKILKINEAVEIVIEICKVLKIAHEENVLHGSIKPSNILVEETDNHFNIFITDFSLSLLRDINYKKMESILEPLRYMSPEQTGAIKKIVDERSDIYSVGIILYKLLTGSLPFTSNQPAALIHEHVAKIAKRPSRLNRNIPNMLDKVILKTIEKEPEKRYQSIEGLIEDLKLVLEGKDSFILGLNDKVIKLNFRTQMIGRESEFETLKNNYAKALKNTGGVAIVRGEPGIGKTRLIEEFRNYIHFNNGFMLEAKAFSGNTKVPYAVFKEIVNKYINYFREQSEEKKEVIKQEVKKYVGDLGAILVRFNESTKEILGEINDVVELENDKEKRRFQIVISRFILAMSNVHKGMVILLDDLQWVDEGSICILNELMNELTKYPLLVLVNYRDNEVSAGHILYGFIKESMEMRRPLVEIVLKSFEIDEHSDFISNLLYDNKGNCRQIADYIYSKTKGNPFFSIEILRYLTSEKAVYSEKGSWYVNREILESIDVTSRYVDLLMKRIKILEEKEFKLLSYASIIGRKFDINLLYEVAEMDREDFIDIVDRCIQYQLIEKDMNDENIVLFVHDRLKEAFYNNFDENKKKEIHLKIAEKFEKLFIEDKNKIVFDIAMHYDEAGKKDKSLQYLFPAGKKAMEIYAYKEAIVYLNKAKNLFEEFKLTDSEEYMDCLKYLGNAYLMNGQGDSAVEIFNLVLPRIDNNLEKAEIYKNISAGYFKSGNFSKCEEYGIIGLSILGEKVPNSKLSLALSTLRELIVHISKLIKNKEYEFKKGKDLEKYRLISKFSYSMLWSYVLTDMVKGLRFALRAYNITEEKVGKSQELGLILIALGGIASSMPMFPLAKRYIWSSYDIHNDINSEWGIAQSLQFIGVYYNFTGDYAKAIENNTRSVEIYKAMQDIKEYNTSLNMLVQSYYNSSQYERMKELNDIYHESAANAHDIYTIIASNIYYVQYYRETGDFEKAINVGTNTIKLARKVNDMFNLCSVNIETGIVYLEEKNLEKAIELLEEAREINETGSYIKQFTVLLYPYLAESYLLYYVNNRRKMKKRESKKYLVKVKKTIKKSISQTKGWPTHFGGTLRVIAKYYDLIEENDVKSCEFYEKSIEHCKMYERKYEEGKTKYEYGLYLEKIGNDKFFKTNLEEAYEIFLHLGAKYYLKLISQKLGIESSSETEGNDVADKLKQSIGISSIIKVSRDLSSILNLNELLDRIFYITIEVSGAQKGCLFFKNTKTKKMEKWTKHKDTDIYDINEKDISVDVVNEVLEKGESVITEILVENTRFNIEQSEKKSIMCLPIKYNNDVIGICYLENSLVDSIFTEEIKDVLNSILSQAAVSIENAKLYREAITDGLTGLITHQHFKKMLERELKAASMSNSSLALIIFDIDYFKKFNDTYGHQAGDFVLENIANIILKYFNNSELVARYGGEEFTVILPNTNSEEAYETAENLRKCIEESVLEYEGIELRVTISVGISSYPEHADNPKKLIQFADDSLYYSKEHGRNRVTVYQPDFDHELLQV